MLADKYFTISGGNKISTDALGKKASYRNELFHALKEHCEFANLNFQECLLEEVQRSREGNEVSHPCDCHSTAEAGSSGSKSLTRCPPPRAPIH